MEKWEMAARDFIDSCDFKNDIVAAFLSGSYAFGNADEFSDIDLFIILDDAVDYRERGNRRVDGFIVEYFANPMRQIKKYIEDDMADIGLCDINMIMGGIVIYDKNNAADDARAYCERILENGFAKMSAFNIQMGLYFHWDNFDELRRAHHEQTPDFNMLFHRYIQQAFELYSRYICSPAPSYSKLYKWLSDDGYFNRYGLPPHKDQVFAGLIKQSFELAEAAELFALAEKIYKHVADGMGGFEIENFTLRSSC
ncbi:MAG: nucleotidyltransferase domain-containing protein [Defluviitaleaceae bacterium]|nr:nucleotidyltransferase domain-containing protein [Defluviitaleaceae bacterium]